jgi:hypothetical protein
MQESSHRNSGIFCGRIKVPFTLPALLIFPIRTGPVHCLEYTTENLIKVRTALEIFVAFNVHRMKALNDMSGVFS